MTKFIAIFTALFIFTTTPVFAEHADDIQHDVTVAVDGMVCDFCAQSLKKVFSKEASVEAIDVDLDKGEIIIDLKDGQKLDNDKITKLVVDSGYTVTGITNANTEVK